MSLPVLSIIIVSYNSKSYLEHCLNSLQGIGESREVIIVDNASQDGTVAWVHDHYPQARVLEVGYNAGYAEGNNIGIAAAEGQYFLILNPDTRVMPGAVETMLDLCTTNPDTVVTPKILQPDGTINACGNTMHFSGITSCTGLGQAPEAYEGKFSTLLISGAAFMVSREVWNRTGGFDSSFFMYMEDADLSLRLWLYGYSVVCAGDAVVYHDYQLNLSSRKFYYLERNRLLVLFKLYQRETFRRLWLGLLFAEFATLAYALRKGPRFLWARFKGYAWLATHTSQIREARQTLQSKRKMSDQSLLALMRPYLPYQDLTSPGLANLLSLVTTPVFRTVQRFVMHL